MTLHIIDAKGKLKKSVLGQKFDAGEQFQVTVKSDCWFAASVNKKDSYSLVGCTVSPGFEFSGFTMAPPDWVPGQNS